MTGRSQDWELAAASDPNSHPQLLSDIAGRRPDLHRVIAGNPNAFPELRAWIAAVSAEHPGDAYPTRAAAGPGLAPAPAAPPTQTAMPAPVPAPVPTPTPAPRRSGVGWWLAGCGCLLALAVLLVGIAGVGGVIAALGGSGGGGSSSSAPREPLPPEPDAVDPSVREQLASFESERARYSELLPALDGNPVAPLVTDADRMDELEARAQDPSIGPIVAASLAKQAKEMRKDLEHSIAAAKARRSNASGTVMERIVDRDTDGFVRTVFDAAKACGKPDRKGWRVTGCTGGRILTIHFLHDDEYENDLERRMLTIHELAHIYQSADARASKNGKSYADRLLARGLFRGSEESMADCYSLTYYDRRSLSTGKSTSAYEYACDKRERRAIRRWAARIDAPLP